MRREKEVSFVVWGGDGRWEMGIGGLPLLPERSIRHRLPRRDICVFVRVSVSVAQ